MWNSCCSLNHYLFCFSLYWDTDKSTNILKRVPCGYVCLGLHRITYSNWQSYMYNWTMNTSLNGFSKRIKPDIFKKRNISKKSFGDFKESVGKVNTRNFRFLSLNVQFVSGIENSTCNSNLRPIHVRFSPCTRMYCIQFKQLLLERWGWNHVVRNSKGYFCWPESPQNR